MGSASHHDDTAGSAAGGASPAADADDATPMEPQPMWQGRVLAIAGARTSGAAALGAAQRKPALVNKASWRCMLPVLFAVLCLISCGRCCNAARLRCRGRPSNEPHVCTPLILQLLRSPPVSSRKPPKPRCA